MDLDRRPMKVAEFLTERNGSYTGLMEEWWQRSKEMARPITHWIVEANAAQRFLTELTFVTDWAARRGVRLVQHTTHRNKLDPKFGPQVLANLYRFGRVRLPAKPMTTARATSSKLVDEVTKWPRGACDDCVMSQWFLEANIARMRPPPARFVPVSRPPSWMGGGRRIAV